MSWNRKVKVKHLFTESEEHSDIQKSMNDVADVLKAHYEFSNTGMIEKMRRIPKGGDFFTPTDFANKLLADMYNIADDNRIWIE